MLLPVTFSWTQSFRKRAVDTECYDAAGLEGMVDQRHQRRPCEGDEIVQAWLIELMGGSLSSALRLSAQGVYFAAEGLFYKGYKKNLSMIDFTQPLDFFFELPIRPAAGFTSKIGLSAST